MQREGLGVLTLQKTLLALLGVRSGECEWKDIQQVIGELVEFSSGLELMAAGEHPICDNTL